MSSKSPFTLLFRFWNDPDNIAVRASAVIAFVVFVAIFAYSFAHRNALGNKGQIFESSAGSPTGITNPASITTGDFNEDDIADVAVVNQTDNTISVLMGNNDGTFGAPTSIPLPAGTRPVAIATSRLSTPTSTHFDLAVVDSETNSSNTLSVPSFTIAKSAPSDYIQITDDDSSTLTGINASGMQSTATPTYTFKLTSTGETTDPITITYGGACTSSTTTATAGLNTITFDSLADGTYGGCKISVTDGLAHTSNLITVPRFTINTATPPNEDGIIPLPVVTQVLAVNPDPVTDRSLARYTFSSTESGTITYGGACSGGTPTTAIAGDNTVQFTLTNGIYSDCTIQVTNKMKSKVIILPGDGTGSFGSPIDVGLPATIIPASAITIGDENHDASPDIFVGSGSLMFVLYKDGLGDFSTTRTETIPELSNQLLTSGDYNHDGYTDIISIKAASGENALSLNDTHGGLLSKTTALPGSIGGAISAVGDFNHDHIFDIASYRSGPTLFMATSDGSGVFGSTTPITIPAGISLSAMTSADFNSDGYQDLAVTDIATGNVYTILNLPSFGVTNITSSTTNGSYRATNTISIQVTFDVPVLVTGDPQLELATGTPTSTLVDYTSGSGTDTLTFDYTVASGNTANDLDYTTINALTLNGGSIKDAATGLIDATLTLPAPGASGSLGNNKSLIVDTTAPTLTEITPISASGTNHTPSYTFSYTDTIAGDGAFTYTGGCTSATSSGAQGSITITLTSLALGTYASCAIIGTDLAGNSTTLALTPFAITSGTSGGGGGSGGGPVLTVISEVTPVTTPSTNHTPAYVFYSNEPGTIIYGGSCRSATTQATLGQNTIVLSPLSDGTYKDCRIQVTSSIALASNVLTLTPFTIISATETTTDTTTKTTTTDTTTKTLPIDTKTIPKKSTKKPLPVVTPDSTPIPVTPPDIQPTPLPVPEPVPTETVPAPIEDTLPVAPVAPCTFGPSTTMTGMIADEIETRLCFVSPQISGFYASIRNSYTDHNFNLIIEISVLAALLCVFLIMTTSALFLDSLTLREHIYIPARCVRLFLRGAGFKSTTLPWGTIYNSVTKEPIDPARITLYGQAHTVIATTLTTIDGTFSFSAIPQGTYTLEVTKEHYQFPSAALATNTHDEVYTQLYHGEAFTITNGVTPRFAIPIDPVGFSLETFFTNDVHVEKVYGVSDRVVALFTRVLFWIGSALAVVSALVVPSLYAVTVVLVATILFCIRRASLDSHTYGYITDKTTGLPLSFSIVRTISSFTNREAGTCVLDATGRYALKLPKGTYFMSVEQKMPNGTYRVVAKELSVTTRGNYLAKALAIDPNPINTFGLL